MNSVEDGPLIVPVSRLADVLWAGFAAVTVVMLAGMALALLQWARREFFGGSEIPRWVGRSCACVFFAWVALVFGLSFAMKPQADAVGPQVEKLYEVHVESYDYPSFEVRFPDGSLHECEVVEDPRPAGDANQMRAALECAGTEAPRRRAG